MNAPVLTVSLSALTENYRLLRERFGGGECAAVVKANAYGLGVEAVSRALREAGCRTFFVATTEEGVHLRSVLPEAAIYVFHGPYAGEEGEYAAHRLIPVLNSVEQAERWLRTSAALPFALHVDTGMNRLGLTQAELERLLPSLAACQTPPSALLSHLACGNEPQHPKNAEQLARFQAARALLPDVPASLCNSAGIFLGGDFRFDLARPGCALYGINPASGENPMRPVVTLAAPILQIRTAGRDDSIGYGATYGLRRGARTATVQLGYADGFFRALSNRAAAFVGGHETPLIGRVSMDMVTLDVSAVPDALLFPGAPVEFLNARHTVDDLAHAAGTIGYEVLTRMGGRIVREYKA